jgi:hypothetical protein
LFTTNAPSTAPKLQQINQAKAGTTTNASSCCQNYNKLIKLWGKNAGFLAISGRFLVVFAPFLVFLNEGMGLFMNKH